MKHRLSAMQFLHTARRAVHGAVASLACVCAAGAAHPQETYPARPIQMVLPTTVGGGADSLARLFGQKITEATGKAFVVNNIPGAGGIIGVQKVTSSAPDGRVWLNRRDERQLHHSSNDVRRAEICGQSVPERLGTVGLALADGGLYVG